jgi:hypothetical protein
MLLDNVCKRLNRGIFIGIGIDSENDGARIKYELQITSSSDTTFCFSNSNGNNNCVTNNMLSYLVTVHVTPLHCVHMISRYEACGIEYHSICNFVERETFATTITTNANSAPYTHQYCS